MCCIFVSSYYCKMPAIWTVAPNSSLVITNFYLLLWFHIYICVYIYVWLSLPANGPTCYRHQQPQCWWHDDVIKWKYFLHFWPFVWGIHRSPVNSPHKGQWRRALMFSLICAWINGWVNKREAGDLRCLHAHYDVTVMIKLDVHLSQSPFY